jgi:hypothetical protein
LLDLVASEVSEADDRDGDLEMQITDRRATRPWDRIMTCGI